MGKGIRYTDGFIQEAVNQVVCELKTGSRQLSVVAHFIEKLDF